MLCWSLCAEELEKAVGSVTFSRIAPRPRYTAMGHSYPEILCLTEMGNTDRGRMHRSFGSRVGFSCILTGGNLSNSLSAVIPVATEIKAVGTWRTSPSLRSCGHCGDRGDRGRLARRGNDGLLQSSGYVAQAWDTKYSSYSAKGDSSRSVVS